MHGPAHTICPGCALALPSTGAAVERERNASAECWQRYQDVAGFELTHVVALGRFHQLMVDTYGAQHAGPRSIRLAYSLVGLPLALERGFTGDLVRRIHQGMGKPAPARTPLPATQGR